MKLTYDLHIHSCLSPCGDDESTPNNILNMSILNGLDVIALTDHNSCKNCPAIVEAAAHSGSDIIVLPGMELCTSEEIHVVCLFDTVDKAMAFDEYIYTRTMNVPNRPDKFGSQLILDSLDNKIGDEERLLITAADISVTEIDELIVKFGGAAFPAHIDKSAFSILASLGEIPPECRFGTAEIKNPEKTEGLLVSHEILKGMNIITDSDAHYLWDISEGEHTFDLKEKSAAAVLSYIKNGRQ